MADPNSFPQNIVLALIEHMKLRMSDHVVVGRAGRPSDPPLTIGVFADGWTPLQDTLEIAGTLSTEPTLNRYVVKIQNLVISVDEVTGRSEFSVNCKKVRAILYRDTDLRVALTSLSEEVLLSRESVKKFGVTRQEFLSGANGNTWMFLATTHMWVETETVPT